MKHLSAYPFFISIIAFGAIFFPASSVFAVADRVFCQCNVQFIGVANDRGIYTGAAEDVCTQSYPELSRKLMKDGFEVSEGDVAITPDDVFSREIGEALVAKGCYPARTTEAQREQFLQSENQSISHAQCTAIFETNLIIPFAAQRNIDTGYRTTPSSPTGTPIPLRTDALVHGDYIVRVHNCLVMTIPATALSAEERDQKSIFPSNLRSKIQGLNQLGGVRASQGAGVLIGRVIKLAMSVIGTIALVVFIYGGLLWMTARGNSDQVHRAMRILTWGALGVIVILSSYTLIDFILQSFLPAGSDLKGF